MTTSLPSRAAPGLPRKRPVGLLSGIPAMLLVALLPTSGARAQSTPQQGAQIWDRLGCWNCHGSNGYTNLSRAGRPSIARTQLPLRSFVGQVRLPMGNMPPAVPWLAPDADLAVVYHWLGGAEGVASPPVVTFDLETSPSGAEIEIEVTAQRAHGVLDADARDLATLDYRVTLITNSQVVNEALEYQRNGRDNWSKAALSEDGEALLGRNRGFTATKGGDPGRVQARLRMPVPTVRTVLVIEALAHAQSAKPVVVGIGSVVLKPAQRDRGRAVDPAPEPPH